MSEAFYEGFIEDLFIYESPDFLWDVSHTPLGYNLYRHKSSRQIADARTLQRINQLCDNFFAFRFQFSHPPVDHSGSVA